MYVDSRTRPDIFIVKDSFQVKIRYVVDAVYTNCVVCSTQTRTEQT